MKHFVTSDLHFGHGNIMKYTGRTLWMNKEELALYEKWKKEEATGEYAWKDEKRFNFHLSRESVRAMDDGLIDNINKVVGVDDVLWVLGDWCFAPEQYYSRHARSYRNQINCRTIHYIWGNHDLDLRVAEEQNLRNGCPIFNSHHEQVLMSVDIPSGRYWVGELEVNRYGRRGTKFMLNHYCMAIWNASHKGVNHLYGHSHAGAEEWMDKAIPGRRAFDAGVDNAYRVLGEYRPFDLESEIVPMMEARKSAKIDHH